MTLAAAATAGYLAVRRRLSLADRKKPDASSASASKPDPFVGLPLGLGDVVSVDGDERWLAGACVARDGSRVVGVLFFAPEGANEKAVMVQAPPDRAIFWL